MCYWCVVLILCFPSPAIGDAVYHVRPIDSRAAAILARAIDRSPLVRDLVDRLAATNVIVHLELSIQIPSGVVGITRFSASRGGYRYLRVSLDARLRDDDCVPLIGHELQHAMEIADSQVNRPAELQRLMETIGYRTSGTLYETDGARAIEKAVRREVREWRWAGRRRPGLQTEPVVELHHKHLGAGGAKTAAEIPKR